MSLVADVPLPIVVQGETRRDEIFIAADFTVTASSSTVAKNAVEMIQIETESMDGVMFLTLSTPEKGQLSGGSIQVRMPSDMHLDLIERGGTADVLGMAGAIRVNSASHVRIDNSEDDLVVGVQRGNAIINTDLAAGKITQVSLNAGDLELAVPIGISADIQATGPSIVVSHPSLPRWPGGTNPYRARVSGGLNTVRLTTGAGTIVIRSR